MRVLMLSTGILALLGSAALAQRGHQTDTVTPIILGNLPYEISLQTYDFGVADLPTLHSFAAAQHDGQWVLLAGRTNGLHGFDAQDPENNFPSEFQNREVWVIDPVAKASWHRSLAGAAGGLTEFELNALTPVNSQFMQAGDQLYLTGGYGVQSEQPDGTENFGTFDTLTAIHLPAIVDWVKTGNGQAADHVRQIQDPVVKVTGGAMYELEGRTHLVFGQDFDGVYSPARNGAYTSQVRSFNLVDDGIYLSLDNPSVSQPDAARFRRRDLNVFPTLTAAGANQLVEGLVALSGVFTTTFGAWTVPVEIDAAGGPTMADPDDPDTFKQGFNGYHSAKLGMFSAARGEMHEVLFGGISLQYRDEGTGEIVTDDFLPFVNDITSVVIDEQGDYAQHHLGYYPELTDGSGQRLRFGANAEFFVADDIPRYENGVIMLDMLTSETTLGYIFGGLVANGPHTRGNPDVISAAANTIFEVVFSPGWISGDYDRDGAVGPDDFELWKMNFASTTNLVADGNGNYVVDAADYTIWRNNLAATAEWASVASAPEPATGWLAAWLQLLCMRARVTRMTTKNGMLLESVC